MKTRSSSRIAARSSSADRSSAAACSSSAAHSSSADRIPVKPTNKSSDTKHSSTMDDTTGDPKDMNNNSSNNKKGKGKGKKSSDTKHSTMDDTTGDPKDKNSASTSKGTRTAKKDSSLLEGLAFNSDEEDELPLALVKILRETKDVKPRKGPKKECRVIRRVFRRETRAARVKRLMETGVKTIFKIFSKKMSGLHQAPT